MYFETVDNLQRMTVINVEVASYTKYSHEELSDFMVRTKLNHKMAYSKDTAIVFYIQQGVTGDEVQRAHEALAGVTVNPLSFLVGQVGPLPSPDRLPAFIWAAST